MRSSNKIAKIGFIARTKSVGGFLWLKDAQLDPLGSIPRGHEPSTDSVDNQRIWQTLGRPVYWCKSQPSKGISNEKPTLILSLGTLDPLMTEYNQSIYYDRVFCHQDIAGSIAWAKANHKTGILSPDELRKIVHGLLEVKKEWEDGKFEIKPEIDEDIHTANERRLSEIIGKEIGGKLHTGYGVRVYVPNIMCRS